MALKESILNLNTALRTTLQNVPAVVDTLVRGFDEIGEDVSTGADVKKTANSFTTINGGLLSECKVALSPNQDLHGYDNPWVGGAGKNKLGYMCSCEANGVNFTYDQTTGAVSITGTATAQAIQDVGTNYANYSKIDAGTYKITGATDGYIGKMQVWGVNNSGTELTPTIDVTTDNTEITMPEQGYIFARYVIYNTRTVDVVFYPMIRLSSVADDSFAPYSNICPISGHTQVDVDVSDGQTTQEQVTVNLGGTYYSGTLDVVSGEFTVDSAFIASYNGETLPSTWISDRDVYAVGTIPTTGAEVCYKLATPQSIQLSPTMVKALVDDNNLTAPLDGQEIEEVEYKEIFTYSDVEKAIDNAIASVYPEAPASDGSYVLTLVKDGTSITRSWVSTEA